MFDMVGLAHINAKTPKRKKEKNRPCLKNPPSIVFKNPLKWSRKCIFPMI
jgi:hypothetical protein